MNRGNHHTIFYKALFTWLLFLPVVFLNVTLRELVYKPYTGELIAHQISTVIACVAFVVLAYFHLRRPLQAVEKSRLWRIGLMWVVMTVLFEFSLGRLVTGASWDKLFYDYNLLQGRIWILLLVSLFLTPFLVRQWAAASKRHHQYNK